jgi:hypothetical protein
VFEHLHWARRGVRGGQSPQIFFSHWDDIFAGRHITGTTYFWDHMIFRWFFGTWFFADGFLFSVKELGFWMPLAPICILYCKKFINIIYAGFPGLGF